MTPGSIFVEAPFPNDVKLACKNFIGYLGRFKKISMVPMKDAVALLCHRPPDLGLHNGSWVRLGRSEYTGDLAYLYHLEDDAEPKSRCTRGIACVRVVPRLSQLHLKCKRGEARPPPKQFFDPLAWGDDARPMKDESGRWKFRGALYKKGTP